MLIILVFTLIFLVWFVFFLQYSDFSYPNANTSEFKKLLVIFPHPDDEALTCGGLIRQFRDAGKPVTLLTLTRGERGTEGARECEKLKKVREKELADVVKIFDILKHILDDFGDGELKNKKSVIQKRVAQIIEEEKPDLIVTYDESGLYGHPDHIVVAEIVKDCLKDYINVGVSHGKPLRKLWFVSFPPRYYQLLRLPTYMADNPKVFEKKTTPNLKLFTGCQTLTKIRALYSYKSQLFSFQKSSQPWPLWWTLSARLFEYYYEEES